MCALTSLRTQHLATPRRRTRTTGLVFLTRGDAGPALKAAMSFPALSGPAPAGPQSR